ncbi:MAG: O-antigen ligase family protein, partial [Terracidiphilus sp.]
MRRTARLLLLLFAFTIPWEISLNLGEPWGNAARIAGILVLLAAVPAVFQAGRMRVLGAFCWITLVLLLWFACTCFWSIDLTASLVKIRAYFQDMMIVWLIGEFADTPEDLRNLLRATVAGSLVLGLLTLVASHAPDAVAAGQIRFAAYGEDPNDVARFLDLGFPLAALLARSEHRWAPRAMAIGYFPVGMVAVLLTASRSGFLDALVALAGSLIILAHGRARRVAVAVFALPPFLAALWFIIPGTTLERLATIPEQLGSGDLNQRVNIWSTGWEAFTRAPLSGSGVGTFVTAARTAPMDSAHNTELSILVGGGFVALFLASLLVALAVRAAFRTQGLLRLALVTSLLVWAITTLIASVEENRTTWLLFGVTLLAARLSEKDPASLAACFRLAPMQPT